jgi:hypothetical protein
MIQHIKIEHRKIAHWKYVCCTAICKIERLQRNKTCNYCDWDVVMRMLLGLAAPGKKPPIFVTSGRPRHNIVTGTAGGYWSRARAAKVPRDLPGDDDG